MSDQTRGFLLIVLASVCLATLPTAVKLGLDVADPVQLLAPRMALGAALIALWIGVTRPGASEPSSRFSGRPRTFFVAFPRTGRRSSS